MTAPRTSRPRWWVPRRGLGPRAGLDAQHLRERDAPSMDPRFHGADRHVEDLRDVVVGHVLHVGEHHGDAVVLGDLGQSLRHPHRAHDLVRAVVLDRTEVGLRSVVGIDRPQHGPSFLAPQRVVAGVHPDAVEPGAEGRLAAELVELAHRHQEGVLRRVMRVLGVAHDPQAQAVDVRPVPLDQGAERVSVPAGGEPHEVLVGGVVVHIWTLHGGLAGGLGLGDDRVVLGEVQSAQARTCARCSDRDRDGDGVGVPGAEILAGLQIGFGRGDVA